MREIKFRMWGGDDSKNMFTSEECKACLMQQIDFNAGIKTGYDHCGLHNSVFMQFTGLKDKNGKEIYEGDILKTPNGFVGKVIFGTIQYLTKNDCFKFHGWMFSSLSDGHQESIDCEILQGEVIGNIYQDPELL